MIKPYHKLMLLPIFLMSAIAFSETCMAGDAHGPHIRLSDKVLDFGRFKADEPQDSSFTVYNDGDETLAIHTIFSGCGCTRTSYEKKTIQPGDSSIISVHFNGKGRPVGRFRKAIVIRSNARNTPVHIYADGVIIE